MTPDQEQLIQTSFAKIKPTAAKVATLFYGKLFDLNPALRALFKHDMAEQGRKLMGMIGTAVANLRKPDVLLPAAQRLGRDHRVYGVKDADYDTVAQALLWALEQSLGADFTPAARAAWTACYTMLATEMKTAPVAATAAPSRQRAAS